MEKTELTEKKLLIETNKKLDMLIVMSLFYCTCIFAQNNNETTIQGTEQIKAVFATIYAFFTSAAIRVIAIAGVIVTGIKIITNKGNPDAAKPLIWIFIACIIIGSASWFVEKFMGSSIGDTSTIDTSKSWY